MTSKRKDTHYGLCVGDVVTQRAPAPGLPDSGPAQVTQLDPLDNNRVYVRFPDGSLTTFVAEWCDIAPPARRQTLSGEFEQERKRHE